MICCGVSISAPYWFTESNFLSNTRGRGICLSHLLTDTLLSAHVSPVEAELMLDTVGTMHTAAPPPPWQHSLFSLISVVCEAPIWLLLSFTIYTCYILEQFAACLWPRGLRLEIQRCKLSFKCAVTLKINDRGSLRKVKNKQNTGCQPSKKVLHADEITQCCWSSSVSAGSLTS